MLLRACIVLIVISLVGLPVIEAAISCVPNDYYSYIHVVNEQTKYVNKLRIFEAITSQTMFEYPRDWEKFSGLYDQLSFALERGGSSCEADIKATIKLQERISQYYTLQTAPTVTQILRRSRYPNGKELKFLVELASGGGLPTRSVHDIFKLAINQCLEEHITPYELAAQLSYLSAHLPIQVVWNAQIHLYWTWKSQNIFIGRYIFNMAFYTAQIKKLFAYKVLDATAQEGINQIVTDLPSSLQYLFHQPKYCLLNNKFEEFLYTTNTVRIDADNIFIFTWTEKYHVAENGPWVHNTTQLDFIGSPDLHLFFSLRSSLLNKYMYRTNVEKYIDLIVSRDDHSVPNNSDFTFELLSSENVLLLRQDGKLVCCSSELYSVQRRYVYAYEDEKHTPLTKECQWIARQCPNTN